MPALGAPAVSQADIGRATALLSESSPNLAESVALDGLDSFFELADLIPGDIPSIFFEAIFDRVLPGADVVLGLTGDSGAVLRHSDQLHDLAEAVRAQGSSLGQVGGQLGTWQGLAAEACRATYTSSEQCVQAAAGAIDAAAAAHLELGGRVAAARVHVIELVVDLVSRLAREVFLALPAAGLAIAGGVVTVVASTVAGGVKGLVSGIGDAVTGGGPGAIVDGVTEGVQEGVEEGLQRAMELWLAAIGAMLSGYLADIDDFVESAIEPMVALIGEMGGAANRMDRAASLLTTGEDPGNQADAPTDGAGHDAQGTDPQTGRDADLIALNRATGGGDPPEGYSRADADQLAELGLTEEMLTDENGFVADVFIGEDGDVVVGFGGTTVGEGGALPDVVEDAVGAGTMSPQTEQALAISDAIAGSSRGDDVVYTGHSLGGRLASIASLNSGNAAVTYNAAGVSDATLQYLAQSHGTTPEALLAQAEDGQVRAYNTGDDVLTRAQQDIPGSGDIHDGVGHQIEYGENDLLPSDLISGHVLDNVEEQYEGEYGVEVPEGRQDQR